VTLAPKTWPAWTRKLITVGGSAGVGATIALSLIDKEHHLIVETFRGWGAPSLLGLVALVLFSQASSRGMDLGERVMDMGEKMIEAARESAASQQKLADAVAIIAQRDDYRTQQQEILMGHVGSTMEKVLDHLQRLEEGNNKARGASA
jgi:hypothetical protein